MSQQSSYWARKRAQTASSGGYASVGTAVEKPQRRPIAYFDPSTHQQALFDWIEHGTGNAVVVAVAGSGKTTSMLHGALRMAGSVIYLAYNKKIVTEVEPKLYDFSIDDRVMAKTFHSVGFTAWRRIAPRVKMAKKSGGNVEEKIAELQIPPLFIGFIKEAVSLAKQWGIGLDGKRIDDPDAWNELVDHFSLMEKLASNDGDGSKNIDQETVDTAISYSVDVLKATIADATNQIDFDDMIYMPLYRGARFDKYDWVLVDEAQDSNPTRRMIAARLMHNSSRAIFVGDPHQAIYGFTGANSDALDIIQRDFEATELPLTITYRCPKLVVEVAHRYVQHIEAAETAPEGHHEYMDEESFNALGRVDLNADTAILCRNTKPLVTRAYDLIVRDIPCHVEGKEIGYSLIRIIDMFAKVRSLEGLLDKIRDYRDTQIELLTQKRRPAQAEAVDDRCEALLAIGERMPPDSQASDLKAKIMALFDDTPDGQPSRNLTLSTIHKSKGREWSTVYWIGANRYQPSKYAKLPWQQEQETNLCYVAATRAMDKLVEVDL